MRLILVTWVVGVYLFTQREFVYTHSFTLIVALIAIQCSTVLYNPEAERRVIGSFERERTRNERENERGRKGQDEKEEDEKLKKKMRRKEKGIRKKGNGLKARK